MCLKGWIFVGAIMSTKGQSLWTALPKVVSHNHWFATPIQWVLGFLSQGLKRLGREADHSSPKVPKIRKTKTIPPLPLCFCVTQETRVIWHVCEVGNVIILYFWNSIRVSKWQWRTQEYCSGGFSKLIWGQRTERKVSGCGSPYRGFLHAGVIWYQIYKFIKENFL